MKIRFIFTAGIILSLFALANCGGNVYSAEQCEKTFNSLFDKITAKASEEDKAKFAPMRGTLMTKLRKDCMAGKFDLECIENANDMAAMQTCLR